MINDPPSFTHHHRTRPSIANPSSRTSQSGSAFAAPFLLNARSAITAAIAAAAAGSGRIAQCQPAVAAPAAPAAAAAVAAAAAAPSAAAAAAAAAVAAEIHPSVHEPPPSSTIGFAEELVPPVPPAGGPGAGEGGAGAAEKVEPRLTVASITKSLIAGGVAGGVHALPSLNSSLPFSTPQVQSAQHAQYSGTWQGLKTIWREEGINPRAVQQQPYQHVFPDAPLLSTPQVQNAQHAHYSGTWQGLKTIWREEGIGRPVQNAQHAHYSGTWQGLKTIWREEGIRGLFRGNGTNCARIVPNSAVKFFAYEEAAHGLLWLAQQQSNDPNLELTRVLQSGWEQSYLELTPVLRLGAGATAGIIAMSATYPMDMVRGRLTVQVGGAGVIGGWDGLDASVMCGHVRACCIIAMSATYPMDMVRGRLTVQSGRKGEQRYKGMRHAAVTIVKEEGVRALYRGWLPSVIGVVPYVGLNFAVYETLKDQLGRMYAAQHPRQPRDRGAVSPHKTRVRGCGGHSGADSRLPPGCDSKEAADGGLAGRGECGEGGWYGGCGAAVHGHGGCFPEDRADGGGAGALQGTRAQFCQGEIGSCWFGGNPSESEGKQGRQCTAGKQETGSAVGVVRADGTVAAAPQYTGMVDAFRKIVQMEGGKGALQGTRSQLCQGQAGSRQGTAVGVVRVDGTVAAAPQYTGMVDAFRKTVQMEGVRALRGSCPTLSRHDAEPSAISHQPLFPVAVAVVGRVVPSIAIAFVTYEVMRDLLHVEIRISD
ncbi:unnamed protein product [Closterium sp. NIES-65]|nr:unnamed protein product [Closterium sp. NIES-65]